jgi:hypothetical protein
MAAGLTNVQRRREFVGALVRSGLASPEDILYLTCELTEHSDIEWLLNELQQADERHREQWAKLVSRFIWGPEREKHRALLLQIYRSVPILAKFLPTPKKGDINVTLERHERAGQLLHERMERRWKRARRRLSRRELLDHAFDVIRHGKSSGWVGLTEYVYSNWASEAEQGQHISHLDITTSPGWQEMSPLEKEEATEAARRFLVEHEDKREHLNEYSNYAGAGYLAIRLLRGLIGNDQLLRRTIRRKWIYCVTDRLNNAEEEHQEQIALVYRLAPKKVMERVLLRVRQEDGKAGLTFSFGVLGKAWCANLCKVLSGFIMNVNLNARTVSAILRYIADRDRHSAVCTVRGMLDRKRQEPALSWLVRAVGVVSLFDLPEDLWNNVWPILGIMEPQTAEQFFLENVGELSRGQSSCWDNLTDHRVGELYCFLLRLFPAESDPQIKVGIVHNVTSRQEIQRFRDECIQVLVKRATESALEELDRLVTQVPRHMRIWLRWSYTEAIKNHLRGLWIADVPSPAEVFVVVQSSTARRVEDEESLREAVLLSLSRLQAELDRDGVPSARDLWNEPDPRHHLPARPKSEEVLSNLIRKWLAKDLDGDAGIIINCEVKVERFGRGKVDVKVQAVSSDRSVPRRITLIIEVKRSSHHHIARACKSQLVDSYLVDQGLTHGIYLVGWYGSKQGESVNWRTRAGAQKCVQRWADASRTGDTTVAGFLLDCRLRDSSGPTRRMKGAPCLRGRESGPSSRTQPR